MTEFPKATTAIATDRFECENPFRHLAITAVNYIATSLASQVACSNQSFISAASPPFGQPSKPSTMLSHSPSSVSRQTGLPARLYQ